MTSTTGVTVDAYPNFKVVNDDIPNFNLGNNQVFGRFSTNDQIGIYLGSPGIRINKCEVILKPGYTYGDVERLYVNADITKEAYNWAIQFTKNKPESIAYLTAKETAEIKAKQL